MRVSLAILGTAFASLFTALAFIPFAPTASAQSGQSTPGVTVTAQNPGTSPLGSPLRITLTAHTERSGVSNPSCRPQDLTLLCWGSLVLRDPEHGGFSVTGFQVHRVAIGNTSCGGEDEGGDCGGDGMAVTTGEQGQALQAQVNGIAFVADPGNTGVAVGTKVQLLMALTDNGPAQYGDQIDIVVNRFVEGQNKPLLYDTGEQPIQQVTIHQEGNPN